MPQQASTASALELTRRAFAAANGEDRDALMAFFGPDSVWDVSHWGLGTHVGSAAIRRFFADWMDGFEGYAVAVEELHDVGGGVVYGISIQSARAAGGGGYLRLRSAPVFVWSEGVAVHVIHYRDADEARLAAEMLAGRSG